MRPRGEASRNRRACVALLSLVALPFLTPPSPAAALEPEPAFCASKALHDYLAPLKRMPKLHELPYRAMGEGRFRGVRLGASGPSLAVSGGRAGYQLPMPLYFVAPGTTSGHCTVFPIPASMPTGRYRLSQETVIGWPAQRHELRPILHAEFDVVP